MLLPVSLGMRESFEDWQSLARDLISRGLGAPMLIVADGASGLVKAIEQCWPASDRQRCCVHRARNLYAKVPDRERERIKHAYWQALDEAISAQDGKRRLQALVDQLDLEGFTAASRCLAEDLDALVVYLRYPLRHRRRWRSTNLVERSLGEVKRRTKVMGRSRARPAASPLSGPSSTFSSPIRPTGSTSPPWTANASNARNTTALRKRSTRRSQPPKLTSHREPNLQRQRDATRCRCPIRADDRATEPPRVQGRPSPVIGRL